MASTHVVTAANIQAMPDVEESVREFHDSSAPTTMDTEDNGPGPASLQTVPKDGWGARKDPEGEAYRALFDACDRPLPARVIPSFAAVWLIVHCAVVHIHTSIPGFDARDERCPRGGILDRSQALLAQALWYGTKSPKEEWIKLLNAPEVALGNLYTEPWTY